MSELRNGFNLLVQGWGPSVAIVMFAFWFGSTHSVTDQKIKTMNAILENVQKDVKDIRAEIRNNRCECNR